MVHKVSKEAFFFSFFKIHKIIVYHIIDGSFGSRKGEMISLRTRGENLFTTVFVECLLDARPLPNVGDTHMNKAPTLEEFIASNLNRTIAG